jgi:hypothetical protein
VSNNKKGDNLIVTQKAAGAANKKSSGPKNTVVRVETVSRSRRSNPSRRLSMTVSRAKAAALVREKVPALPKVANPAVGQFADPVSYKPVRLPDVTSLSSAGTAIASLAVVDSIHWPLTCLATANLPKLASGDPIVADPLARMVVVLRDPIVMAVVQDSTYHNTTGPSQYNVVCPGNLWRWFPNEEYRPVLTHVTWRAGPKRYGDFQPVAHNAETQAFWVDASPTDTASLTFSLTAIDDCGCSAYSIRLVLHRHLGDGDVEEGYNSEFNIPVTGGTVNGVLTPITAAGYYSICMRVLSFPPAGLVTNRLLAFTINNLYFTMQPSLCHRHIVHPDIATGDGRVIQDVRVLGSAFLASNVTAEFFKGGAIYAQQTPPRSAWFEGCESPAAIMANNVHLTYDGPLQKGFYGFVKPQGLEALSLRPALDPITDGICGSYLHRVFTPFASTGQIQVLFLPPDTTASTNSAACTLVVHFTRSMEFTSQSQIVNVNCSQLSREQLLAIMDALDRMPQFFENPLHWAQIKAAIANSARWAWNNRAMLVKVLEMLVAAKSAAAGVG